MPSSKIHLYKTVSGKQTITNFIDKQSPKNIAKIRNGLRLLETYGLVLQKTKWLKKIKQKPDIFELRITGKQQFRLLFSPLNSQTFLITHIFIKKSKKTPQKEIRLATKRALEFL